MTAKVDGSTMSPDRGKRQLEHCRIDRAAIDVAPGFSAEGRTRLGRQRRAHRYPHANDDGAEKQRAEGRNAREHRDVPV